MPFGKAPHCKAKESKWGMKMKFFPNKELKDKKKFIISKTNKKHGVKCEDAEKVEVTEIPTKWRRVRGLTGQAGTFSFESIATEGNYLRHCNYLLREHAFEDSKLFKCDATFINRKGKAPDGWTCFESVNFPGHFIGINGDGALQIMETKDLEDNFCFRLKKSINRKCLKEKHEKGLIDEKSIWSSC